MNSKSNCHHGGKLILTSVAAATLGLIVMSPDMAKADTLVRSAVTKKRVTKSRSFPETIDSNQTSVSTDSPAVNSNPASTTSKGADSNVTHTPTSPNSETKDSNDPPTASDKAKGITPRSVLTISWSGINVTLDTDTGIATIPGGTIKDPQHFYHLFNNYKSIKKIRITGPLKVIGTARSMFDSLSGLTEIEGLNQVDTSEVTSMEDMFFGCQNLSSLDLSSFNTSNVTDMSWMFNACYKLSSLDLSNFDTAKVTNMSYMFYSCPNLKTLNISSFQMAQVTTSKSEMLKSLPKLSTLVLGPKNYLQGTGLDASGVWLNVGNGTVDKPQGNKSWTSSQLMSNYSGSRDQDTYVRLGEAVTVHYLDEAGKKLAEDKILNGRIGYSYSSEPQDVAGYVVKTTPANAKGTYTDKAQEVTYVYTNQVKVLVHYVDQDGKPIAGAPDQTISGIIGQPYPDNVVKDIPGYTLKSKPTGKFSGTETEVTYVYTNQVKVLAHYVDQDGKPIAADDTLTGKIGDDYPAKEIAGYVIQTKPAGKFSGTETEITYVYTNQVKVLAHYVDQDGKPIAADNTLSGKIGDDYPAKEIAGYVIQTKPAGKFSGTETEVTYVYTNQVKVLAHYVDQDGKPIAADETLTGKIGDDYPAKEIAGYVIQTKPAGKFSGTETEVTYVYTNQVNVLAHYVDQDGKPVAEDETISGKIGDDYPAKEIAGYVIQTKPAGKFSGTETEVTYVYTNQVKVLAHYVDQDGKPIASDETLTGKIGNDYPDKTIAGYIIQTKPTGKFSGTETEVTYVYTNQVKVLAHYVDQDGKPIAADETLSGKIGDPYPDSAVKDIKGYTLKTKPAGKFSGTETEVTYVYTNQVKVLAHYVDQDGKPIAGDETISGKIGDDYPAKEIAGYVIQTKPAGKFSGTETEVTYVYTNQVKVLAHYVDQDGKPIAADETLSGKIGDDYPAKEIAGYVIQTKPAGKFSGTETEVTYVYTNQVKVLAHYVDQDGKPIAADDTLTGKIGDDYPAKEIAGYVIQTKPTGKFSPIVTEVTYVYTNQVKVLAHYVDQDGKPIAADDTLTGKIGDDYPAKEIAGYVIQTKPTGKFSPTVTEVTYIYTNQVKVLVHYVDQDGKPIAADDILNGKIGDDYPDKTIKGYVIQTKPTGKFSSTVTEVTYVYTNQVKVLAHYIDQDGKPIADDDTLNGKIGDDYPAKEIAGYVIQTKPTGKFSGTETEVTYVYTNQVKVLAHYVDQDGKPIADDDTLNGKIGDDYPDKTIKGYVIQTKPAGKFSGSETEVTYVYTNQVKVLAHYVDQDGKPIAADDNLNGKIGDDYPDKTIKGYVIQTKPTGKFSGSETEVTYVYTNQVKVLAHYVDQDGKPIAADDNLNGKIGDDYPDKTIKGYVIQTKPSGKFSGTETEVTYVYAKNTPVNTGWQPILGGTVTVHYQDETGQQLAPDQVLNGNVGDGYLTQEVKLTGYNLTQRPNNATGFYTDRPQSVTYIYSKNVTNRTAVKRTVLHNSYLYDQNGSRKTGKYFTGKTIWTYGTKVIQGKKYYDLGQNNYIKATNVSGVKRKLRCNSYVYSKAAKKLQRRQRKFLKKGQKVRTYGAAVKIQQKLYYIVGKNQYVKKSDF